MLNRKITILGAELKSVPYFNTELIKLTNTGIYEIPFETVPTIGKKHNYKTCKECQKNYKKLLADFTKKYNGKGSNKAFPYCCTEHSLLSDLPLFKKSDYDKVPKITADKVIFTWNHIINNIDNTDFYNEITDYIYYTIVSHGTLPNKSEPLFLSAYINHIITLLKATTSKNINYKIILDFINENYTEAKPTNTEKKNSLERLLKTYEDWVNLFPFEISFFSNFKIYFERQMPLASGELHYNKYLDLSIGKTLTRSSLVDFLMKITNNLLSEINCLSLYEKGLLTKPEKIKLELIISKRKLKLNRGYLLDNDDEKRKFEDMLNEWLTDEKKFIDEVTPLLKAIPPQTVEVETTINEKLTAKHYVLTYIFDCNAIGESLPYGSKKELERIGNERLGAGKGNTFYKNYNTIIGKDLNAKQTLIDVAGENWRNILLQLSNNPEALEKYLQSKQL